MFQCNKCNQILYEEPENLVCRCGGELYPRAYYLNGQVYQGEMYSTIQLRLLKWRILDWNATLDKRT